MKRVGNQWRQSSHDESEREGKKKRTNQKEDMKLGNTGEQEREEEEFKPGGKERGKQEEGRECS